MIEDEFLRHNYLARRRPDDTASMSALEKARAALAPQEPATTPETDEGREAPPEPAEALDSQPLPEVRAPRPAPPGWFAWSDPSLGQKPHQVLVRGEDFARFEAWAFQRNIKTTSEAFRALLDAADSSTYG